MFRRALRTVSIVLASMTLLLGFAGTASAAPTQKGHTEVQSGLLDLAELFGILKVEAVAPTTRTGNVYSSPVVGNWEKGTVKTVGSQLLTNRGSNEQMSIANLWLHNDTGTASAVINNGDRMTLFTIERTSDTTANLLFTADSAALFNKFVGLPLLSEGTMFGTATQTLTWPPQ
jgi:hypothetical protein